MIYHQIGRIDIKAGRECVQAFIGDALVLSKCKGRPWTVAEDIELPDVITAAVALLEFEQERTE